MGFNPCFVCLAEVDNRNKNRREASKVKLILGYLLGKRRVKSNCDWGGDEASLCEKCGDEGEKLLELHLQLECVQMKIIERVKVLKRQFGSLEVEEKMKALEGMEAALTPVEKDGLERIKMLQKAVKEKGKQKTDVPFVLLERYGAIQQPFHLFHDLVKTEPEDFSNPPSPATSIHCDFGERVQNIILEMTDIDGAPTPNENQIKNSTADHQTNDSQQQPKKKPRGRPSKNRKIRKPSVLTSSSKIELKRVKGIGKTHSQELASARENLKLRLPYSCKICSFSSAEPNRFEKHLMEHESGAEEKQFECDTCQLKFSFEQHLNFHMERHKQVPCPTCLEQFTIFELQTHIRTHRPIKFPCSSCPHSSPTLSTYLEHFKDHSEYPDGFNCDICEAKCVTRDELQEHQYTIHKSLQILTCYQEGCDKIFMSLGAWQYHKKDHLKKFECRICHKRFSSHLFWKRHEEAHKEHRFKCDKCFKGFISKYSLEMHVMCRHDDKPKFKCNVCGKDFNSKSSVEYHRRKEHSKSNKCPVCNKTFGTNRVLEDHILALHGEKGKGYMCEDCGKTFMTKRQLEFHRRIHMEKKYQCSYCSKVFSLKKYLINHEIIHTGQKPFVCEECGRAYNQYASLYAHRKKCKAIPTPISTTKELV